MDQESANAVPKPTSKIMKFVKDYGQTVFTVGSLIFASGGLYAKVQNISDKTDNLDYTVSTSQINQAKLGEKISALSESQKVQSESTNKLADAVNTLSNHVAKMEGQNESKSKRR